MPQHSSAPHFALVSPCPTHRRDAFYIVESRKRQYYVLVLGHIALNPLPDPVLREYVFSNSTSLQSLQHFKSSEDLVLILYLADSGKRPLSRIDRSVISLKDVSTLPHTLESQSSLDLEKRAKEAIDALEYVSDADKAFLKSGPLGFGKNVPLSRAQSLPPIIDSTEPHPLLLSTLTLYEPASKTEWKIVTAPTPTSPTWTLRTSDNTEKSFSYPQLWTLINATVTRKAHSPPALLENVSEPELTRLEKYAAGDTHNPYIESSFPLAHLPILFRSTDAAATKQGYVIHVASPMNFTSVIDIYTVDGFVDSPTLHIDSRFDNMSALQESFKPGWAICPFGIFRAPKPPDLICQPALLQEEDRTAKHCHICLMSVTNLSAAQTRDHYNKLHSTTLQTAILDIPDDLLVKQCDHCKVVFVNKGLSKHKQNCSCRDILCPIECCRKKMTSAGDSNLIHLVNHLKTKHLDSADGAAFLAKTAGTILTVKSLRFCNCPKHSLEEHHHTRLYTREQLNKHLKPSKSASPTVCDGEIWNKAHVFIRKTLDSLNPDHVSFKPVWADFRTRHFDYYEHQNVTSSAFAAYNSLLDQLISLPADDGDERATTLWFLVTYFDPLIFRGDKRVFTRNKRTVRKCIDERVAKLLHGDIEELWTSMLGKPNTSLRHSSQTPKEARVRDLMEKGRFSDAANEATSDLLRPHMDDSAIEAFRDAIVPPSLQRPTNNVVQPRNDREDPEIDPSMFIFTPPDSEENTQDPDIARLKKIISQIKRGKGAGFLGDTLDFFKVCARNGDTLPALLELIRRVLRGQLPPMLRPAFNLLAGSLFVKPDTTPVAYRPIGCPSALNRIVGKFFCSITKDEISKFMLNANQFAVGVKGGMTLLLAAFQLLIQQHLNLDEDLEQEAENVPSKRAGFSLDLTSMFNLCDLDIFFAWADNQPILKPYIPFLETRYKFASTYILKKDDGTFVHVTQPNGCAQGCPLAPLIASCCLLILITKFMEGNLSPYVSPPTELLISTITHFAVDSDTPPVPISSLRRPPTNITSALHSIREQFLDSEKTLGQPILSYMDDMSTVASYSFILAFSRFLVKHGPAAGVHVNWAKTQVLLGSTWDEQWRDVSEDGTTLRMNVNFIDALKELGIPDNNIISTATDGPTKLAKLKGGIKILGAPFGFNPFCKAFRTKTLEKQMKAFDAVSEFATDKEHLYKLIRLCIIPKVYHMFTAASSLNDIAEFAKACHAQHIIFFKRFLNDGKDLDAETEHSFELATLLVRQGGIQFTSPLNFYQAGFLASWSKLFFVASRPSPDSGVHDQSPIHPSILRIVSREIKSPTLPCCVDFRRCYLNLAKLHPIEFDQEVAGGEGLPGLIKAAAADKLQHTIVEATSRNHFLNLYNSLIAKEELTGFKSHLRRIMPSSAQYLGSHYLDNLDMGKDKMSSEAFLCYTKLKLGLPILNIKSGETLDCPFCSKQKVLNRYGDHIFSCYYFMSQRTSCMHNPFRDTVAYVLSKLTKIGSPKASYISSVTIEKTGLVPNTALRPADVYMTFSSEKKVLNHNGENVAVNAVALDITYTNIVPETPVAEGLQNTSSFSPAALPHLVKAEASKRADTHDGRTYGGTAQYLAERSIAFVPIAIDPLGGMGAQASLIFHDTHTGRRLERTLAGKVGKVPAIDLEAANWITPGRIPSEDPTLHLPPFHPPSLNGQFKAAIEHLRKNDHPTREDIYTYQAHATVQRLALSLSMRHVDGVATVVRIFTTSISAAKGRMPKLPSLSTSDAYVECEVTKAADYIKGRFEDDDVFLKSFDDQARDGWSGGACAPSQEAGEVGHSTEEEYLDTLPTGRRRRRSLPSVRQHDMCRGSSASSPHKPHHSNNLYSDAGFGVDEATPPTNQSFEPDTSSFNPSTDNPSHHHQPRDSSSGDSPFLQAETEHEEMWWGKDNREIVKSPPCRRGRLGITTSNAAFEAALALRHFKNTPHAHMDALRLIIDDHRLCVPTHYQRSNPHRLARALLQIIELSFASVATLPREVSQILFHRPNYVDLSNALHDDNTGNDIVTALAVLNLADLR